MKLSRLKAQIDEALKLYGDMDVVLGEENGAVRVRIDMHVDKDLSDIPCCIIQAYALRSVT